MQWVVIRSLDGGETAHSASVVQGKNEKEAIRAAAAGAGEFAAFKLPDDLKFRDVKHTVSVSS